MKAIVCLLLLCLASFAVARPCEAAPKDEPGLLFYLSGDKEFDADYAAGGDPKPNFLRDVRLIKDGARGRGFECADSQIMSYWAQGNIYAERGTLAFSWRSRYAVGPTAFPIFRVGYADHSSWDMAWLRIDYNGRGGFDAFVTDANLSRIRVSYVMPSFPKPDEWVHLAVSWDETRGIRFYVNGVLAAKKETQAVLYAGLDQFGPHSRTIGPMQVQSDYNFVRGGDLDELRIYDRMLSDGNVASLSKGVAPREIPSTTRKLSDPTWRGEWWLRYGWNRAGDAPPYLNSAQTSARKVEILDVFDLKRWWWKGTDGIRETTWPGVYNRSRLPGRNDYFQLPDWDCYSLSGKAVTFTMPDEPWNQLEISGAAWGRMTLEGSRGRVLFERPKGQEKTFHRLSEPLRGQKITFTNVEQEQPIGELSAYNVAAGAEPRGSAKLEYTLTSANVSDDTSIEPVKKFIAGRYTEDERATVVAVAGDASSTNPQPATRNPQTENSLPLVHVIIPAAAWRNMSDGLDGIAIDLPPLHVKPTHGALFPLNAQVKDPLWPNRNLFDLSLSVKPNEARTLWLDTRDRILPEGKALYLTIAGAGADFGAASLEGARVRLVFKPRAEALKEHEIDRFTQARDSYAMLIEEHSNSPRLNLYNRFAADTQDLLRVNPNHWLAQSYWYDLDRSRPKPSFTQPVAPAGVPLWAFRQVEQLRRLKQFVLWYIDHRQIENGEFGGGLSDDGDLTNWWPGTALMGVEPSKIDESLRREMDAFYAEGMFTAGLPTIQADELHSYEEGIQVLGQSLLLDYGDPKQLERAMETSRSLMKLTGVNKAGHRHIRSSYYSGTKMATEEPWGWSKPSSILVFHPALMLARYNGSPAVRQLITELADGFLAHRRKGDDGRFRINGAIRFEDDKDVPWQRGSLLPLFWGAYQLSGDAKYLQPFKDDGPRGLASVPANGLGLFEGEQEFARALVASANPNAEQRASAPPANVGGANSGRIPLRPPPNYAAMHMAWQLTGDKHYLESLYAAQIEASALREYMNTEGSMWIDRVEVPNGELQRARLGGVALTRGSIYPGNAVSWSFRTRGDEEKVAILIPNATPDALKVVVYNLSDAPVDADMTAWDLEPGWWDVAQGLDADGDDAPDGETLTYSGELERSASVRLTFTPHATTVVTLKLVRRGTPYWSRPDLGIGRDDVVVRGRRVTVTVHSLGSVDTQATTVALVDARGKTLTTVAVPALKAPTDLQPKRVTVTLDVPSGADAEGASVVLNPEATLKEITRVNNRVKL